MPFEFMWPIAILNRDVGELPPELRRRLPNPVIQYVFRDASGRGLLGSLDLTAPSVEQADRSIRRYTEQMGWKIASPIYRQHHGDPHIRRPELRVVSITARRSNVTRPARRS
jgi:hypothetical protein